MACGECARLLSDESHSNTLAKKLEAESPDCACEGVQLGKNSHGPITSGETLVRLIVSPRDYDPITKLLAQKPFEKVYGSGVSVMRDKSTNQEFADIGQDAVTVVGNGDTKTVMQVCLTEVDGIRSVIGSDGKQAFCVYDQMVPRRDHSLDPVPGHAGIFLRDLKMGAEGSDRHRRDMALTLFEKFKTGLRDVSDYRPHVFDELNAKARAGLFRTDQA